MNILFVNDIPFNPLEGGLERVTDVIARELISRGYNIYYLCGKLSDSKLYLLDYDFPAKLFQLPQDGLFDNEENGVFYKQLQSNLQIDVVVNQRGLGGWFNRLLPITNTKIISVIHSEIDADIIVFLNKLVEYSAPPFASLKRIIKTIFPSVFSQYWKRKALKDLQIRYNETATFSDVIVTLCNKSIDKLKDLIDAPYKSKIVSIPNPNTFNCVEDVSIELKSKIILYVGRLSKKDKEPLRLLKIWKNLHEKHSDWCLKIVGCGSEEGLMRDYIREFRLNNVFLEGRQSDVAQYYKEASFVCLTSNYEGWGMALTEGMQYGCVPFTFNNYCAAFDIIQDGVDGCLVPAFNIKRYSSLLSKLMMDDNKRIKMSRAAMEKVRRFSVENVVDKWEDVFNSLGAKSTNIG